MTPIAYELVPIHARNWASWHSDYHLLSHYLITPDLESQVRWTLVVSITCVDTFTTSTRSGGATSCNASWFTHWTSQLVNDQFHMVVQVCWLLCSSGTFCSTWAGRLWLRRLARWQRSFSLRYSVRALGLWQYGWYVMMRAWEISQAYKVVQGVCRFCAKETRLTQELRLRVWGWYGYRLK